MYIEHFIRIGHDPINEVQQEIIRLGIPFDFVGESDLGITINDNHPGWLDIAVLLQRYQPYIHHTTAYFTHEELSCSDWIVIETHNYIGYPQPERDYKYLEVTYDLSHYCQKCHIGQVQDASFRLKGEPKWMGGRTDVFSVNWIYDILFVKPSVWKQNFKEMGIDCLPVIKGTRGESVLQNVVQLHIDKRLPGLLKLDDYPHEVCPSCHAVKYATITDGKYPMLTNTPPEGIHAFLTQEYFRFGAWGFHQIVISNELYQRLSEAKVKGLHYIAIENPTS